MSDIEEKREELIRRLKKVALISSIILAILVAITVAVRLQPIVHPTGKSLIKWGMLPYMQKNSIRGTADIKNDVTVDLSSSLGSGMTSDIAVATTGSAFVVDNNKMYIGGSTSVKYSDLAETTNYFKVYKDLKKSKQYVYYINSEPGQDYMTDYENWAAIDAPKTSYDNIPEAIGKCLYNMSDMTMTKLKNSSGYTVEGKMDESSATALIRCLMQADTKNTCLTNGIEITKSTEQNIVVRFNAKREITSIKIVMKDAKAGSTIKINELYMMFTIKENKQTLEIPSLLTKAVLDSDFDIPVTEDDIANDLDNGSTPTDPNGYLKDINTLLLKFDGKDITDLNRALDIVKDTKDMSDVESTGDTSVSSISMKKDAGAKVYIYTDQTTGNITQIGFDTSYSKEASLPVTIAGMGPGITAETAIQILGDPSTRTTGNGLDTLTYSTADSKYIITLTFYQGDSLTNAGLQKVNIRSTGAGDD